MNFDQIEEYAETAKSVTVGKRSALTMPRLPQGVGFSFSRHRHDICFLHPCGLADGSSADCFQCFHDLCVVRPSSESRTLSVVCSGLGQLGQVALFEYLLQVPANRIGFQQAGFSVAQLKIMQEVITLAALFRLPISIWVRSFVGTFSAALCMVVAVYFVFRGAERSRESKRRLVPTATSGASQLAGLLCS
jgi:uncharacterized protein (DUF486 family)